MIYALANCVSKSTFKYVRELIMMQLCIIFKIVKAFHDLLLFDWSARFT